MNIIGNTFGNLTSFEILRRLEKPEKSKRMEKLLNYIENFKHRFIGISLAFSIPFIPSALVNYACVQMNLPTRTRILATLIGVTPVSIVYAVSGDLLLNIRPIRIPLVAVLAILLFISLSFTLSILGRKKMSFIQVTKEEFNTHAFVHSLGSL
ncbi:MAG: TVP38/TMEM64 family protein [Streptococcus sp.]